MLQVDFRNGDYTEACFFFHVLLNEKEKDLCVNLCRHVHGKQTDQSFNLPPYLVSILNWKSKAFQPLALLYFKGDEKQNLYDPPELRGLQYDN